MVQWQAKNLFFTWPQCDETKEVVLSRIRELFGSRLLTAIVAEEKHQNGDPHLHAFVSLSEPYRCRSNQELDALAGQHGNYQAARSPRQVIRYVTKGGNYLLHGKDQEWLSSYLEGKSSATSEVHSALLKGVPLKQVIRENPWTLRCVRQLEAALPYLQTSTRAEKDWVSCLPGIGSPTEHEAELCTWFNTNVGTGKNRKHRPIRTPQLWIQGPPGCGKTSLIQRLQRMLSIYLISDEEFQSTWNDDVYDLAVLDEYNTARKTITFLNRWLDGSMMPLAKKGGQTVKKQNVPTVILSNHSPREVYHKIADSHPVVLEALCQRLQIITIPDGHGLHNCWSEAFVESLPSPANSDDESE